MDRKRVKWIILTMLWSASLMEVSSEKAEVCWLPKAEKGECRGRKIQFTWHAQQDRSENFPCLVNGPFTLGLRKSLSLLRVNTE